MYFSVVKFHYIENVYSFPFVNYIKENIDFINHLYNKMIGFHSF